MIFYLNFYNNYLSIILVIIGYTGLFTAALTLLFSLKWEITFKKKWIMNYWLSLFFQRKSFRLREKKSVKAAVKKTCITILLIFNLLRDLKHMPLNYELLA